MSLNNIISALDKAFLEGNTEAVTYFASLLKKRLNKI